MKKIINAPLKKFCGFGCGGNADVLIEVETKKELESVIRSLKKEKKKWYIIGDGYNTLISDNGVKSAVLRLRGGFTSIKINRDGLIAGCGASLKEVLDISIEASLGGNEFLAGIPGTVGGAIYGNAGSLGCEIVDVLKEIEVFNSDTETFSILDPYELGFTYRNSSIRKKEIITGCVFVLEKRSKIDIADKIKKNLNYKRKKQPVNFKSCGCVFKNSEGEGISAAKLIEDAGLKGLKIGAVSVSDLHANFLIVDDNTPSSKDIWQLICKIRESVKKKFNMELELEINLLGEDFIAV